MEKHLSPEEMDVCFREVLRKLPSVRNPARLEELSLLALAMILHRAGSHHRYEVYAAQIKSIVAASSSDHSPDAMRAITRRCVAILRAAREGRQPHAAAPVRHRRGWLRPVPVAIAAIAVLSGGYLVLGARDGDDYDPDDTTRFVEQIVQAAAGSGASTHLFGGQIDVSSMNGIPVVTVRGVPPRACAASGMRLVKKGLLGVNGETPARISSAIITELCNKGEGAATMMWAPTKP